MATENRAVTMEKLVNHCKPGSSSRKRHATAVLPTPGIRAARVEFKNNVKRAWWKKFVQESPYNTGVDCAILMNPSVWKASGHLAGFSDPLMDCKSCRSRHRADNLIEDFQKKNSLEVGAAGWSNEKLEVFIKENKIPCPVCGKHDFTSIRNFNLMFKTFQGVTEDTANTVYLRPETAQGIFVNLRTCKGPPA